MIAVVLWQASHDLSGHTQNRCPSGSARTIQPSPGWNCGLVAPNSSHSATVFSTSGTSGVLVLRVPHLEPGDHPDQSSASLFGSARSMDMARNLAIVVMLAVLPAVPFRKCQVCEGVKGCLMVAP